MTAAHLRSLAGLVAGLFAVAAAQGQAPSREVELERIRGEIFALEVRLRQLGHEKDELEGELSRTGIEVELQEERLAEARAQRADAQSALEGVESDVATLEGQLEGLRESLRARLLELYRMGRHGYLRLFLSIGSDDDLMVGIRQLRFIVHRDGELLQEYVSTRERLQIEREQLRTQHSVVDEWVRQEGIRMEELTALEARQAILLADLQRRSVVLASRAETLEKKERKLSGFIDYLYGRYPEPPGGVPVQQFQGVLDWPVSGEVQVGFGPRLEPRYKTRVPHNGLKLTTQPGVRVQAIFAGKVLFAAVFEGYGLTVIVHHPGRVFSLYAGLGSLGVKAGDVVSLGQGVGLAAEWIYFEIREENRPVDPRNWLR